MPPTAALPKTPLVQALVASVAMFLALAARGQDPYTYVNNVFPLAPRELRQHLTRAKGALDEERYSDVVAEIGEVLNSAGNDDFFLGAPGSADAQVSSPRPLRGALARAPVGSYCSTTGPGTMIPTKKKATRAGRRTASASSSIRFQARRCRRRVT